MPITVQIVNSALAKRGRFRHVDQGREANSASRDALRNLCPSIPFVSKVRWRLPPSVSTQQVERFVCSVLYYLHCPAPSAEGAHLPGLTANNRTVVSLDDIAQGAARILERVAVDPNLRVYLNMSQITSLLMQSPKKPLVLMYIVQGGDHWDRDVTTKAAVDLCW